MLDHKTTTFLTLCEQLNYRKTAELLNMTQPGVTQHIHALENKFGCKLFSYDGKTVSLTEQGRLYRNHLQKVKYDEARLVQQMAGHKVPVLHIGATKSIGDYMIADRLVALLNSGQYTVDLTVDNTKVLLEQIRSGKLDFAMIEGEFNKSIFGHRKMRSEPFVGICPTEHRFAGRSLDLSDVFPEHLLVREEGSGTRAILEKQLAFYGETLDSFSKVNCISSFRVMREIIAKGHAITFGYASVIADDSRLASFRVEGFFPHHDLYYVFQEGSSAEELLDRCIRIMGEEA